MLVVWGKKKEKKIYFGTSQKDYLQGDTRGNVNCVEEGKKKKKTCVGTLNGDDALGDR